MSRDQTRNIETFKVGGGRVDEFGLNRQQRETAQLQRRSSEEGPAPKRLTKAEQVAQVLKQAQRKAERRKRKAHKTA